MRKPFSLVQALCLTAWWMGQVGATELNTASEADLDSLKGVGPSTTQRLLAERSKAPFSDWADLQARVKGIRAPSARKLSAQGLTVNGLKFGGTGDNVPLGQSATPKPPPPGV